MLWAKRKKWKITGVVEDMEKVELSHIQFNPWPENFHKPQVWLTVKRGGKKRIENRNSNKNLLMNTQSHTLQKNKKMEATQMVINRVDKLM